MTSKPIKDTSILFVDDEPDFRNALAFSFGRKGYKVFTASNGRDGFDIIRKEFVDVVVSDIRMPKGDGMELLDRTKEEHPTTPIILLVTGFADISTEQAHDKGAEAIFSKPFELGTLQDAIERLLTPPQKRWSSPSSIPIDTEIKVEVQYHNFSAAIEASAVSIGRGGMFVTLKDVKFPNINDEVTFKITFKGDDAPLKGNGIVRWIRTQNTEKYLSGFGLEFTFLGDSERKKIIAYIDAKKKLISYIPNR